MTYSTASAVQAADTFTSNRDWSAFPATAASRNSSAHRCATSVPARDLDPDLASGIFLSRAGRNRIGSSEYAKVLVAITEAMSACRRRSVMRALESESEADAAAEASKLLGGDVRGCWLNALQRHRGHMMGKGP